MTVVTSMYYTVQPIGERNTLIGKSSDQTPKTLFPVCVRARFRSDLLFSQPAAYIILYQHWAMNIACACGTYATVKNRHDPTKHRIGRSLERGRRSTDSMLRLFVERLCIYLLIYGTGVIFWWRDRYPTLKIKHINRYNILHYCIIIRNDADE